DQKLFFSNKEFVIKKNEKIQTEISKKFTFNTFSSLTKSAGWKVKKYWFDKNKHYSIFLLQNQ
ncbi:MAG: L-histidine N(alpha)-methyltransferase, partial [Pelagibacteraceae bacterium]|nr:L-histidine N(alpha)-methyltransferase [Pelagibacteraceae bacterium]